MAGDGVERPRQAEEKIMAAEMTIAERAAHILEMARLHPNFGKPMPPIGSPRRRVKYHNSKQLARHSLATSAHPACPEQELPGQSVLGPDLSHREHVKQFEADASGRDEVVLMDLMSSFDLANPRRPGEWFTGFYFFKVRGIKAANSCAYRLRSHPFIVNNRLDIDSSQVPAAERNQNLERNEWWRYRICHSLDSERIKREEKRKENEPF